jgi:hypothetical protein
MERTYALQRITLQVSLPRAPGEKGREGIAIMLERLTTPPLVCSLLNEAFDTRENIDAVSQGPQMQVGLPPGELRGTLSLVLGRPWTPSMSTLELSPGEIFLDHFPDSPGKHRTMLIRARANS